MVIKKVALLLTSIALVCNVYTKAPSKQGDTSLPLPIVPCEITGNQLFEALQQTMPGITLEQFCNCFPCLCCDCGPKKYIKKNICDSACPPAIPVRKMCCEGQGPPYQRIVLWHCCGDFVEEEPPCNCCPCDIHDCPPPYEKRVFHIYTSNYVPDFSVKLKEFSQIVKQYGGKTCCEEYLTQHGTPGCIPNGAGTVNACIPPGTAQSIIDYAKANGFYTVNSSLGYLPATGGCRCLTK